MTQVTIQKLDIKIDGKSKSPINTEQLKPNLFTVEENSRNLEEKPIPSIDKKKSKNNSFTSVSTKRRTNEHKQRSISNFHRPTSAQKKKLNFYTQSNINTAILKPQDKKPSFNADWLISYNTVAAGNTVSQHNKLGFWIADGKDHKSVLLAKSFKSENELCNGGIRSSGHMNKVYGSLKSLPAQFKKDNFNLWSSRKSQLATAIKPELNSLKCGLSLPSLVSAAELRGSNLITSAFPHNIDLVAERAKNNFAQRQNNEVLSDVGSQDLIKSDFETERAAKTKTGKENFEYKLISNNTQLYSQEFARGKEKVKSSTKEKQNHFTDISNHGQDGEITSDFYESLESINSPKYFSSDVQSSAEESVTSESSVDVDVGDLQLEEKEVYLPEDSEASLSGDVASPIDTIGQTYSSIDTYPVTEDPERSVISKTYPWLRFSLFPHMPPTLNFRVEETPDIEIPPEIKKILKWKSTNVTPVIIRKVLFNSGMRIVKRSQQWISVWAKHMRANAFKTVLEYQKFNHFPGTFQIGRKDTLWRNHMRLRTVHGKRYYDFVPTTYIIPADMKQLRHAWERSNSDQMWIVKPPAAARGSGIKVIHKFVQIPKTRPLVIQKYLSNPYLINGVKFDLRIYVYVTSFYPLRIYVHKEGLARFASVLYSPSSQTVDDKYMHLTNFSINRKSGTYTVNEDVDACKGHKWSLKALWGYLAEQGHNTKAIWNSIVDLVIKTIISCENTVSTLTRLNMKNPASCHELFGFDIILDSKLKPWLLEVNISPSLQSSTKLDVSIKGQMCKDLLNLSGVMIPPHLDKDFHDTFAEKISEEAGYKINNACFDKRIFRSNLSLEERAKQVVFTRMERHEYLLTILANPTPDDIRQLVLAEDERSRAGQYICVFPTNYTYKYHKFFDRARYYNHLFDAWENRYQNCKYEGIQKLIEACKQGLHLRTVPRCASVSSPRTDIGSLSSMTSVTVKCCPRSKTKRVFRRAYHSARSLLSRMRIRSSHAGPKTPTNTAASSFVPTLSNVGSGDPHVSKSSGMSSLAVHKTTDSSQTKGATSLDADHPFQNDDLFAAYTNTWQSHHCNALVKSKKDSEHGDRKKLRQLDRVYPDVRNCFPSNITVDFASSDTPRNGSCSSSD